MATIYSLETDGFIWYVGSTIDVKSRKSKHFKRNQKGVGSDLIPKDYKFQFKILEETQIENRYIRECYWYELLNPIINKNAPSRIDIEERHRLYNAKTKLLKLSEENRGMAIQLFIEPPPWSVVSEIIRLLKLPDFGVEFQKSDTTISDREVCDQISLTLSAYYRTYFRKKYLSFIDSSSFITVLKQILLPHSYVVSNRDTTKNGTHIRLYKIIPLNNADFLPSAIQISFD